MSKSDVEIVNVSPPDMIPALDSGSVDAINIWQPYTYEAEMRLGPRVKGMPYTFTNNYLLLTTTEVAAKNPELLKRTLAVLKEADASLGANKDKAVEWTAKAAGMKPETLKAVWAEMEFGTKAPDAKVLEEMQAFANFAVKNKMVKEGAKMPDLEGAVPGRALERSAAGPGPFALVRVGRVFLSLVSLALFCVVWEGASRAGLISNRLIPAPSHVAEAAWELLR